jgi:excinuclease ABC subunit A
VSLKDQANPTKARPALRDADSSSSIQIRGARVHNLKNLDADLPKGKLVVLTGVSGSGKSSLAFDTIVAEGQRRYLECLSSYARQFLDQLERPDVDAIDGLPPIVAIDQRAGQPNPRSTLGTITEIYDYLRLLFARVGTPHCPSCGTSIHRQTPDQMVDRVLSAADGKRAQILAPLVRARKGQHGDVFQAIRRAGLIRARVDGEMVEVTDTPPKLVKTKAHTIEAVVDRISIRPGIRPRLAESIDLALKLSSGTILALIESASGWDEQPLSLHFRCPNCDTNLAEIEPRSFSFNSPHGACHACQGLGATRQFQHSLVIPDPARSWDEGAAIVWTLFNFPPLAKGVEGGVMVPSPASRSGAKRSQSPPPLPPPSQGGETVCPPSQGGETARPLSQVEAVRPNTPLEQQIRDFMRRHAVDPSAPLSSWPPQSQDALWSGEPGGPFPGLSALLDHCYQETGSESLKRALDAYREEVPCPACAGARLRPEARAVRLGGQSIHQICSDTVQVALSFFRALRIDPPLDQIAGPLVSEIASRLQYLVDVGLEYLPLGRSSDSLSGGELQRARLAAQLGSGLVGVCYILDEPTAGLHAVDTARLIASLRSLIAQGSSALVVEHDAAVIEAADWIVDIGPGAGPDGGTVVAAATPARLPFLAASVTGKYLGRTLALPRERSTRLARSPGLISLRGVSLRNLRGIDVQVPLGSLTCVSGVSGSGKSTLIHDVLARSVRRFLHRAKSRGNGPADVVGPGAIAGLESIEQLIDVDQAPIGRSPRSTPATVTGVFDELRRVFAATREAKVRGYRPGRFSFNSREGRCELCLGLGQRRIPMNFLPDLSITCEECQGKRFNQPTLEVRFKGKSIGEVLMLRVDECREVFQAIPKVLRGLDALHDVGLGYLTLGQSSTTLSGGEAQRVKLAAELSRNSTGRALYLLDEPTTGLHFADIERLLAILERLADLGHAVVVIEHHLDVIAAADWVIDLGPGAGVDGGRVVAMGTPHDVAQAKESRTGEALKSRMKAGKKARGKR